MDHLNYTSGDHSLAEISMDFRGTLHKSQQINELAAAYLKQHAISQSYNLHGYGDYGYYDTPIDSAGDGFGSEDPTTKVAANGTALGNNRYGTGYNDFDGSEQKALYDKCKNNNNAHR